MREEEKMLVTTIFSFSHNVLFPIKEKNHHFGNIKFVVCKCFQFGQATILSFGKELIDFFVCK